MWKKFYTEMTVNGVIFMVRPNPSELEGEAENFESQKEKDVVESRKTLHYLMNENELREKFCLVIFNVCCTCELFS